MTHGLVVCFSGRIGSGKSSVANKLAQALRWPKAGFGDYLRQRIAQEGGDPDSRRALQDLGQSVVDADPDQLCADVLGSAGFAPGGNLVLDGIRHASIYARITGLVAPSRACLVHLSADDTHVRARVASRPQGSGDLNRAQAHPVESDLQLALPELADVVLDANRPLTDVIADCLSAIQSMEVDAELVSRARVHLLESS
jgi:cytidylate kinase